MTKCKLTSDSGAIAVTCPFDRGFVDELKMTVPYSDRRWKGENKSWLVAPKYGKQLQDLCMKYFNELPMLPLLSTKQSVTQKIIDCRYIGQTKERNADERSAFGWVDGGWNVIFPENVLRAWFDAAALPDEQPTLYSVLGVQRSATDDEIKSGYRRMARQWHSDYCKEPNAHEQMIAINHAYEVLTHNRERYNAGLLLEASLRNAPKSSDRYSVDGYRSPLRCGLIMCEGVESMGLFTVQKIFAWEDIKDSFGRVLVVSWKRGEDSFTEVWA